MRPTELGFRNPREMTPDSYNPAVTYDGRSLKLISHSPKATKGSSKRFSQYDEQAKRTGYRIGPGSYNLDVNSIGKKKKNVNAPVYKQYHGFKNAGNNEYHMYGNHLVNMRAKTVRIKDKSKIKAVLKIYGRSRATSCARKRRKHSVVDTTHNRRKSMPHT